MATAPSAVRLAFAADYAEPILREACVAAPTSRSIDSSRLSLSTMRWSSFIDRLVQALGAHHPRALLADPLALRLLLPFDLVRLQRQRRQAARGGVDEQALQGLVVVEGGNQLLLQRIEIGAAALEVEQLPALDAMQLLLQIQYAGCPARFLAHAQPRASHPMKPIMNSRNDSPMVK